MKVPSREDLAQSGSLEELYGKLSHVGMGPGWNKPTPSLWPAPRKTFVPAHWKYEQARGALDAAGRLINTELAERRNLILDNPAGRKLRHRAHHRHRLSDDHAGRMGALAPPHAECAAPHPRRRARHLHRGRRRQYRHGAGRRAADAELVSHGHGNDSRACAYWLDFLDVPLVQLLEPMFFEPLDEDKTHEAFDKAPPTKDRRSCFR